MKNTVRQHKKNDKKTEEKIKSQNEGKEMRLNMIERGKCYKIKRNNDEKSMRKEENGKRMQA